METKAKDPAMEISVPVNDLFPTREAYLQAAAEDMRQHLFAPCDVTVPKVSISVGFPKGSRGRAHAIGQCWDPTASGVTLHHLYISPVLGQDGSQTWADTLAHELVHAAVGVRAGHKREFARCATDIGLEGRMTATHGGEAFTRYVADLVERLGAYPHERVKLPPRGGKGSRLKKLVCQCGSTPDTSERTPRILRASRSMIEDGPIFCGVCDMMFTWDGVS